MDKMVLASIHELSMCGSLDENDPVLKSFKKHFHKIGEYKDKQLEFKKYSSDEI